MAENAGYNLARAIARACVLISAASGPPFWLFSRLTPYHFLFSAPTTLTSFGNVINVCAFTGYLLAAAAIPTYLLFGYVIEASWFAGILGTFAVISMAVIHFYAGAMGYGPPNAVSRAIGTLLLLPVAIRWIMPVQRYFRAHPLVLIPVAYAIGISLAILMAFAYASPMQVLVHITDQPGHTKSMYIKSDDYSFYEASNISEFGFWDWLAAGAGALVYLRAAIIWRNLLKPSAPAPKPAPKVDQEDSPGARIENHG